MVRSLRIIRSEFMPRSTNAYYNLTQLSGGENEKLLYQRAYLLRQMLLNRIGMAMAGFLIIVVAIYAATV